MASRGLTAAKPTKLRSGDWGATVDSETIQVGEIVQITTRAGKSWEARVTRVVWTGKGVAICATESLDRGPRSIPSTAPQYSDARCARCRCHSEPNAGAPGSIMYDGCDYCGCESG